VHRSAESSQHVLGLVPGSSVKPKPSLPIFFFGWLRTPGSLDRLQINLLSAPLDPHVVDIRAGRTCAPMRPGRTGFFFSPPLRVRCVRHYWIRWQPAERVGECVV
jgi:hypothetical protein